jgi:diadenosine tetraphosphatase ApaH/serine/threonine PP2A family protein phosphatase
MTTPAFDDGNRTLLIGDVHGCLDELQDLLRVTGVDPRADRVILVGDLVAKGPDSVGVVALAREQGFLAVLGNHDAKVLKLGPGAVAPMGLVSPGEHAHVAANLGAENWAFLEALPLYLSLPKLDTIVVHGGLVPGVPLPEQERRFLLNLRSITPAGEPSKRVNEGVPWASLWPGPEHVVFGHDAVRGLQQHPHATGLDTGCVYGNALTGLLLPERRLVSVPARRAYM